MKYLGIDYGKKRVGLAFSQNDIAFPHTTIANDHELLVNIATIILQEGVEKIVVGDTRSFGGYENPITKDLEQFVQNLEKHVHLPVVRVSEAGSSVEVSQHAPSGKLHDDAAAAAFILQRYIDMHAGTVD